jgi:hypothetical protein
VRSRLGLALICCARCAVQVETIYLGDRKISIRTSILDEKATACNMLCCYADELKEGFYPWVEKVRTASLRSLNPGRRTAPMHVSWSADDALRRRPLAAMPSLLFGALLTICVEASPTTPLDAQEMMSTLFWREARVTLKRPSRLSSFVCR